MTVTFIVLREVINELSCDFCYVKEKHKNTVLRACIILFRLYWCRND